MDIGQEVVDVLGQFIAYDGDVVCVGDACFPHGESLLQSLEFRADTLGQCCRHISIFSLLQRLLEKKAHGPLLA